MTQRSGVRGGVYGVTERNARRKEYHRRTSRVTPSARTRQAGVVTTVAAKWQVSAPLATRLSRHRAARRE